SMDWSDVKFCYDPILKRVEPIAYESFSAHAIRKLAGSGRYVGRSEPGMDLHTQWFNDEAVFRAYVRHLERVSRKSWLDSAFTALQPALDSASATLYREFPYKELDRKVYYRNQQIIRKLLNPPKAFHAYLRDNGPDTVRITVVPIEALPMEIHALVLPDGTRAEPLDARIIPIRKAGRVGDPVELRFPVNGKAGREGLRMACSVLGASEQREVEVFPYALLDGEAVAHRAAADPRALPFLAFDEHARTISIKPGAWAIGADVELPGGYTVAATAPLRLSIGTGVRLTSRSPLVWLGLEEAPIQLVNDGELVLLETGGRSQLKHLAATGTGRVVLHQAPALLERCAFAASGDADHVTIVRGAVELRACSFTGGADGLSLIAAQVQAEDCAVDGVKDDALVVRGGSLSWKHGALKAGKGAGLKLGVQGEAALEGAVVRSGANGIEVREGSRLTVAKGSIEADGTGILVKGLERISGPSRAEVKGTGIKAAVEVEPGDGNTVIRDGKALGPARKAASSP
ncbi:MAG: hypothetical protein ACK4L7_07910, partial [Flavobacteriales bacterium]